MSVSVVMFVVNLPARQRPHTYDEACNRHHQWLVLIVLKCTEGFVGCEVLLSECQDAFWSCACLYGAEWGRFASVSGKQSAKICRFCHCDHCDHCDPATWGQRSDFLLPHWPCMLAWQVPNGHRQPMVQICPDQSFGSLGNDIQMC